MTRAGNKNQYFGRMRRNTRDRYNAHIKHSAIGYLRVEHWLDRRNSAQTLDFLHVDGDGHRVYNSFSQTLSISSQVLG